MELSTRISGPPVLTDVALEELKRATIRCWPQETGGLLFPRPINGSWIYVCKNDSPTPDVSMHMDHSDLINAALSWGEAMGGSDQPIDWGALTIWHSHPGGGVGPSSHDMHNRVAQCHNLVITLDPDDGHVLPTWF